MIHIVGCERQEVHGKVRGKGRVALLAYFSLHYRHKVQFLL
jgi:hypothetical protein